MEPGTRLLATLVALLCPLLPCPGAAQETASPPPDVTTPAGRAEILVVPDGREPSRMASPRAHADGLAPGPRAAVLPPPARARRGHATWRDWVTEALAPDAPDPYERFRRVFEERVHAPGSPFARRPARTEPVAGALPSREDSDLDLPQFLPIQLREDILRAEARLQELRTLLFGQRGIIRLGEGDASGHSRLRLNLQYDPDPGVRFVLLTR